MQGGNWVVVSGRFDYNIPIAFDQCFWSFWFRYDNFILSVVFAGGLIVEIERNNVFYGLLGFIRRLFFMVRNVECHIALFRFLLVVTIATEWAGLNHLWRMSIGWTLQHSLSFLDWLFFISFRFGVIFIFHLRGVHLWPVNFHLYFRLLSIEGE
jgi:hypothetical protein